MTNLQKYGICVASFLRKLLFGFPGKRAEREALSVILNKYMLLYGIENDSFTATEEIIMQNIFDSISVPD